MALEGFLRWRNDGRGDFGRLERQQLALKGLVNRLRQPHNLMKMPVLLGVVRSNVKTDLNPVQLAGLSAGLISADLDIRRLEARPFSRGGISYLETTWPN